MKPLSVEDGMSEDLSRFRVCDECGSEIGICGHTPTPIRSATPEELTAQAESYGKNYKPGPRQATPFMPNGLSKVIGTWPGDETDAELLSALDEVRGKQSPEELPRSTQCIEEIIDSREWWKARADHFEAESKRALPVPERTAEMDELMGRLRALATLATPGPWFCTEHYVYVNEDFSVGLTSGYDQEMSPKDAEYVAAASPDVILRLLDHIEGKPKLSIQEVQE